MTKVPRRAITNIIRNLVSVISGPWHTSMYTHIALSLMLAYSLLWRKPVQQTPEGWPVLHDILQFIEYCLCTSSNSIKYPHRLCLHGESSYAKKLSWSWVKTDIIKPQLRKAKGSILMQLHTKWTGLGAYLHRINRGDSARCDCELNNQTVGHVLLECPLHPDEREWMRNVLSDQGIALCRDKLLTRPEARAIVGEFIIKTGLMYQFHEFDPTMWTWKKGKRKNGPLGQSDGRIKMEPLRSVVPGPL